VLQKSETVKLVSIQLLEFENANEVNEETRAMKVYEVEYRAVIRIAAQDMKKAVLLGSAVIKDNPHLIYLRAVHERNFEAASRQSDSERVAHSLDQSLVALA
jgi:hypothetical protein